MELEDSSVSSSGIQELVSLSQDVVEDNINVELPADHTNEDQDFAGIEEVPSSTSEVHDITDFVVDNKDHQAYEETETKQNTNGSISTDHWEEADSAEIVEPVKKELTSWPALWLIEHKIDEKIVKLIYWAEWQKTAGIFGGVLFLLLSLTCYSFLSVVTTLAMALLAVSFLYRIGMTIVNAVQKTSAEHPLRHLLEQNIELKEECVHEWSERTRVRVNRYVQCAQNLFLIKDVVESLKFGVLLWLVSYVTAWFSLLTMVIMVVISVFTLPKVYDVYQTEIDQAVTIGIKKLSDLWMVVESKIPPSVKAYTKKIQ